MSETRVCKNCGLPKAQTDGLFNRWCPENPSTSGSHVWIAPTETVEQERFVCPKCGAERPVPQRIIVYCPECKKRVKPETVLHDPFKPFEDVHDTIEGETVEHGEDCPHCHNDGAYCSQHGEDDISDFLDGPPPALDEKPCGEDDIVEREHYERLKKAAAATGAFMHPEYGVCDALGDDYRCAECERIVNALRSQEPVGKVRYLAIGFGGASIFDTMDEARSWAEEEVGGSEASVPIYTVVGEDGVGGYRDIVEQYDLVERLRFSARERPVGSWRNLYLEAADEIERLRSQEPVGYVVLWWKEGRHMDTSSMTQTRKRADTQKRALEDRWPEYDFTVHPVGPPIGDEQ